MCRFALVATLLTGCFYVDRINQRPSIAIEQSSSDVVYRGSTVSLRAVSDDPEEHVVFYQWRAYACTDARDFATCDAVPFYSGVLESAQFEVGFVRNDAALPVESILVYLEAEDDYGAIARPRQELIIPVANQPPGLTLTMSSSYDYVVDTPVLLAAKVSDLDDGADSTQLAWTVYSPMGQQPVPLAARAIPDDNDPMTVQEGKTFTPPGTGRWEIEVTATDPLGSVTTDSFIIDVVDDQAPCLAQYSPITAPAGSALPLTEATLFQVSVVTDVLDPYPTVPGDAIRGTTEFAWSIKQPGASTRTPLAVTGNGVAIDPGNYEPGDIVELRVEIADRISRTLTCADSQPTCSVTSSDTCIQRQTWRMEVR